MSAATRPTPPPFPTADQVPAELRSLKRWIGWRAEWNENKSKWMKPPASPVTGEGIGATEKYIDHFLTFDEAVAGAEKNSLDGVGFVFMAADGFVGIDFDDCRIDGIVQPEVLAWLKWFPTYAEISPSGSGVHAICRGAIAKSLTATRLSEHSDATCEAYCTGRYFTFTGQRIGDATSIADCQTGITKLLAHLQVKEMPASGVGPVGERPWSIFTARKVHADNLESLRHAPDGAGNATLNMTAFFAARAFAAKALVQTEEQIKGELLHIVTREWQKPHSEHGAISTIASGWSKGVVKPLTLIDWKQKFHTGAELETGDVKLYIDGILPEGITAIGSLSAVGKTWVALAMSRALTTGTQFLGVFPVEEKVPVIYLVPEMGARALRKRLERMRIPMNDRFYCQTVSDGVCPLSDPSLEAAVTELKPVVFLDTAVRFNPSDDENSARQNAALLASDLFRLIRWGARAVVCLHHSPKYSGDAEFMTLENVLRGTGDLGAMCDAVWGLQHDKRKAANGKDWDYEYLDESQQLSRLYVKCVKPRDFDAAPAFRIQGRPYIDEKGDFVVLAELDDQSLEAQILAAIEQNPKISFNQLRSQFRVGANRIEKIAAQGKWTQSGKGWTKAMF